MPETHYKLSHLRAWLIIFTDIQQRKNITLFSSLVARQNGCPFTPPTARSPDIRPSRKWPSSKKTDPTASTMTLENLLGLYQQSIQVLAEHTQATRKSILKKFKETWPHGFDVQARAITKGKLKIWLSEQHARLKNSSYNEYLRFLRHLFQIGIDHKIIAESPVAEMKQFRVEKPILSTPTWEQFLEIVVDVRKQKLNASAQESADLVEFMGRAGVGTAECANLLGEHIDFENERITLYRKKTDVGYT